MGGERGVLVSGNWKMHQDHAEAQKFVQELAALLCVSGVPAGREASIHPPFTSLPALRAAIRRVTRDAICSHEMRPIMCVGETAGSAVTALPGRRRAGR